MDITKYPDKKEKGLVKMQSLGNQLLLVSKRFDAETGAALEDEIMPLDKDGLMKQRDSLQQNLDSLNLLLADIDALNT